LRLQGYEPGPGREFQKRLLERVRALPEVRYAGIADLVPVDLHFSRDSVFVDGQPADGGTKAPSAFVSRVSPGYFQAMNTRLVQGRDFTDQDDQNTDSVVIVNETFASQFFPGQDPIGKHFTLGNATGMKRRIIGVAQRGKYAGLSEDPKPFVYRAIFQSYSGATSVVVRTAGEPHKMISAVRHEVQQLDSNIAISSRTLVERMSMPLLPARLAAAVLGGFGVLALVLSAIGIYGVMAFSVSTRTREVGIRMALGAQNRDILTLVIRQALILTLIGVSLGLSSALVLTRLMKSLLFGVSATDLATFAGASVLLAGVALLACYIPARRAMSVDPLTALRHE
jgi:predicted permease